MDIQTRKVNLIQELLRISNEDLIYKLEQFLFSEKRKLFNQELQPMTLDRLNYIIDDSEDDIENNRTIEADLLIDIKN
jgi:hypothetical protein